MNPMKMKLSGMVALLLCAGVAHAQVPLGKWSGNDISDTTYFNTGMGTGALFRVTPSTCNDNEHVDGCYNTASGYEALYNNTTGDNNTASGYEALHTNTTGYGNVAAGADALYNNSEGNYDTAIGTGSLYFNTVGSNNTAVGSAALNYNTAGNGNTATGSSTLNYNTTGSYNTANGNGALFNNKTGSSNTATGGSALSANTAGAGNTAVGISALEANTIGSNNTASGGLALYHSTGSSNIAVGYEAGYNVTTGSDNIEIGNLGAPETRTIRIGTEGTQTKAFVAGIYNVTTVSAGLPVLIDAAGQLGTVSSSGRFKTAIEAMGSNTAKLQQLRPVTFRYKGDSQGILRYGLIAEEVAKVYPELVVRDPDGRIDGVRYDELAPMLLNEMQKEESRIATQTEHSLAQDATIAAQAAKIASLEQQLAGIQTALAKLPTTGKFVAQR